MIRSLDEGLWVMDFPLRMPGGIEIGTRTTLIRLRDGSLFAHSPGPASDADFEQIAALGPVAHVIAPNLFHHFFVRDWMSRRPEATLYAPPGFDKKLPGLDFRTLGDRAPDAWAEDLDQVAIAGAPRMNEIVFCHRASRTLLLTDLCFNMRHSDSGVTRLFMRLMGGYGRFGPSRLARHVMMRDKAAVRASVLRVLALDFDRVVVTHGEVLESGGRQALSDAFADVG